MKKGIILTGTPGTGKTTIAEKLEIEGYPVIYVGDLVKNEGYFEFYDEERESYVVNEEQLLNALVEIVEKNKINHPVIFEGHIADLPATYLLSCIVLRCSIKHLRQRLEDRGYSKAKIEENVEAEIMEVILTDMLNLYGPERVKVVYTDKEIEESYHEVKKIIEQIEEEEEEKKSGTMY
ncbi:MAG: AAA family ATPase [Candidatus Heimdallarchaeaceae archaeon]